MKYGEIRSSFNGKNSKLDEVSQESAVYYYYLLFAIPDPKYYFYIIYLSEEAFEKYEIFSYVLNDLTDSFYWSKWSPI